MFVLFFVFKRESGRDLAAFLNWSAGAVAFLAVVPPAAPLPRESPYKESDDEAVRSAKRILQKNSDERNTK